MKNSLGKFAFTGHKMGKSHFAKQTLYFFQKNVHATSRIIITLMLSILLLNAEDFNYTFHVDNSNPYLKEAVILTFEVKQTNHDVVLIFDFDLLTNEAYTFQRVNIKELDAYHAAQITYTYLVYPLKMGELDIDFKLTQKVTTDDSVAYSFSGDRDNIKTLVTHDTAIDLPPVSLRVKPLPKDTDIVGDFSLNYDFKKHQAKAYEALPFHLTLKGKGYTPILDTIFTKDVNFTVFREKPLVTTVASTQGTQSTVTYPMALSHSHSFTLPTINIKAFNPKNETSYILHVPTQNIDIIEVDKELLVDKVDTPPRLKADWSWFKTSLLYLLVFAAGFMTSATLKWQKKSKIKTQNPLIEKIQNSKDKKALLQLLMAYDSHKFSTVIVKLENSLYGDGKINLAKVKQEAQDLL